MKKIADIVIYGNFYTVDKKIPKAQAVAITNGKFVYVGDADGVKNFIEKRRKTPSFSYGDISRQY